jgi:hypothetical protein
VGGTKRVYERNKGFSPSQKFFIRVVKAAIKINDRTFLLRGEHLEYIAEVCGVNHNVVDWIRAKVRKIKRVKIP